MDASTPTLSGNATNGDFFGGLEKLTNAAGNIIGAVKGGQKSEPKAQTSGAAKFLPFIIIGAVALVVVVFLFRRN